MPKEQEQQPIVIRDLIYFDVAKAESILSQFEGGLLSETETSTDLTKEARNLRDYDFKLFRGGFGGTDAQVETTIERRHRHHEMCTRLEELLLREGLAIDVNASLDASLVKSGNAHKLLSQFGYLKATGWASVEDYTRLQFILEQFNTIVEFLNRAQLESKPEVARMKEQLQEGQERLSEISDRNKRAKAQQQLRALQNEMEELENSSLKENQLEEWLIEGIDLFIDTFLKGRINLFIYPFSEYLPFHVLSSLKASCFVDTDVESFFYSYGARPNLRLTVLGLITSLPKPALSLPNTSQRFSEPFQGSQEQITLERAFADAFSSLQDLEGYFSFSHYPNVLLQPIAIYRELQGKKQTR